MSIEVCVENPIYNLAWLRSCFKDSPIKDYDYYEEFEMDLTGWCPLECHLCTRNYKHGQHLVKKNIRPLSEIIEQLDKFTNLKRAFIAGQVSEPTSHPEFLDYLKYLKKRNLFIMLFTNGALHDTEYFKEIGRILDITDQVHFTVCGINQEQHEKYRVNSNLQDMLDKAEALRSIKPIDYCQAIKFEYNKDDIHKTKDMGFTYWYQIESEGVRYLNAKVVDRDKSIAAEKKHLKKSEVIYKKAWEHYKEPDNPVFCESIMNKKIFINQFGKVSPCYMLAEYEKIWQEMPIDYTDMLNKKYKICSVCSNKCRQYMDALNVYFIC